MDSKTSKKIKNYEKKIKNLKKKTKKKTKRDKKTKKKSNIKITPENNQSYIIHFPKKLLKQKKFLSVKKFKQINKFFYQSLMQIMKKLKYDPEKTVIHSGFPIKGYDKKYKQIWTEKINKNMCWISKFLFRILNNRKFMLPISINELMLTYFGTNPFENHYTDINLKHKTEYLIHINIFEMKHYIDEDITKNTTMYPNYQDNYVSEKKKIGRQKYWTKYFLCPNPGKLNDFDAVIYDSKYFFENLNRKTICPVKNPTLS